MWRLYYCLIPLSFVFLRIAIASSFWVHGRSKAKMWKMEPSEQLPKHMLIIMRILSICEPLGAIAILFGFLTEYASLGLIIIMIGAMYFKIHVWKRTFSQDGGWELDLMILVILIMLFTFGPGPLSLDSFLRFGWL